ncbi:MAG: hypothetical protein AAFP69_20015, partial [Planctomycetota bacterium]
MICITGSLVMTVEKDLVMRFALPLCLLTVGLVFATGCQQGYYHQPMIPQNGAATSLRPMPAQSGANPLAELTQPFSNTRVAPPDPSRSLGAASNVNVDTGYFQIQPPTGAGVSNVGYTGPFHAGRGTQGTRGVRRCDTR